MHQQSSAAESAADLVDSLRPLIASVALPSFEGEQKENLECILGVLRRLRSYAPGLSQPLSKETRQLFAAMGKALSCAGTLGACIGASAAVAGLFVLELGQTESDRRVGRDMTRYGGAAALGCVEVVQLIREVMAEIESALPYPS